MKRFQILALIIASTAPTLAVADPAAVIAAIEARDTAFENGDFEQMIRMMPAGQLQVMADALGEDTDFVVDSLVARVENSLDLVSVEAITFDRDAVQMQTAQDGTEYAIVMTTSYWRFDPENLTTITAPHLVFKDHDRWVIANVQRPRDRLTLTRAYPQFSDVTFPEAQMRRVWDNVVPPEALE